MTEKNGSTPTDAPGSLVLSVEDLQIYFYSRRGVGKAVDGVSLDLYRGQTLGVVGESGSGKSVTAAALVGLLPKPAARILGGRILFNGEDLTDKSNDQWRAYRGKHIAMILQDPLSALNPVFTIGNQVYEPLKLHKRLSGTPLKQRAIELLRLMRIPAAADRLNSYPHQFSGGMRQRVVGAIGLAGEPEVLIADEPTTALDVTAQAAYIRLLKDVQRRTNLAMLFITHDFGIVGDVCDRVAVMYAGRVVETASTRSIFHAPSHPYTKALLRSVPDLKKGADRLVSIPGAPPSIYGQPAGCRFHPRCWLYDQLGQPERCRTDVPALSSVAESHTAACHFTDEAMRREIQVEDRARPVVSPATDDA
ncbi:MAG: ATP-binding cassette domain-containing protein [Streptosporangiales bacterium]|nr:ATP-binding cassette domain-containing protein [Streptosporangiales bacterium]